MDRPEDKRDAGEDASDELARAAQGGGGGFIGEFWSYLRNSRKWWLAPILVLLILLAVLSVVAGSSAAPFIYALF